MSDEPEKVIPLHEEQVSLDKRRVETGRVRVDVHVREHHDVIEQALQRHDVEVERVPLGRPVETMPGPRQEGETLIIPVVEEEIVVSKRLVLREEIHIRPKTTERVERVPVTRRSEEADITRTDAPPHDQSHT